MRLTTEQIKVIKQTVAEVFGDDAEVRLFGSRLNDRIGGGDIDLLISLPHVCKDRLSKELRLTARLQLRLGDQPFDVLVVDPDEVDRITDRVHYPNIGGCQHWAHWWFPGLDHRAKSLNFAEELALGLGGNRGVPRHDDGGVAAATQLAGSDAARTSSSRQPSWLMAACMAARGARARILLNRFYCSHFT